jgi:hypothetical protein
MRWDILIGILIGIVVVALFAFKTIQTLRPGSDEKSKEKKPDTKTENKKSKENGETKKTKISGSVWKFFRPILGVALCAGLVLWIGFGAYHYFSSHKGETGSAPSGTIISFAPPYGNIRPLVKNPVEHLVDNFKNLGLQRPPEPEENPTAQIVSAPVGGWSQTVLTPPNAANVMIESFGKKFSIREGPAFNIENFSGEEKVVRKISSKNYFLQIRSGWSTEFGGELESDQKNPAKIAVVFN